MKLSEFKSIQNFLPDETEIQIILSDSKPRFPKIAEWKIWSGWRSNHDQRIDDAECSNCGYTHPKVYGNVEKLNEYCPNCKSLMGICEK